MFPASELLPISALQHLVYCPRQCALIHLERQWKENRFTAEGNALHTRVDRPDHETRGGVRCEYAVPLRSLRLGLVGKADLVEFHSPSPLRAFPVEYKRGRPKPMNCDRIQLCAQALCLEEMLDVDIRTGAIFYGKQRRRQAVEFDSGLRFETEQTAEVLHTLIRSGKTPPAEYEKRKCEGCSLFEICMPKRRRSAAAYLAESLSDYSDASAKAENRSGEKIS